jgi:hypothetical protein
MARELQLLAGGVVWLAAHLMVYVTCLRRLPAFRAEKVIFLYHAISFTSCAAGVVVFYFLVPSHEAVAAAAAVIALHSIYSMSFLEAWSLSQISYSIAILDAIRTRPGRASAEIQQLFATTGTAKKTARLAGLQRLGLIKVDSDHAFLAPPGLAVAAVLRFLRWVANLRETG